MSSVFWFHINFLLGTEFVSELGTFFGMTEKKQAPESKTRPETWACEKANIVTNNLQTRGMQTDGQIRFK